MTRLLRRHQELLAALVRADEAGSRADDGPAFVVVDTWSCASIMHPALPDQRLQGRWQDLDKLESLGLLRIESTGVSGERRYFLTERGRQAVVITV